MVRYVILIMMIVSALAANCQTKKEKALRELYDRGHAYYLQQADSSAEQIMQQVLGSRLKAFNSYKHYACQILAEIAFKRSDFIKALEYITLSDKKYRYTHFCGNELTASQIHMAEMYSKAYVGLRDTINAIKVLLPEIIETGLASNKDLIITVAGLLKAKYDKRYLNFQLNTAIEKLQPAIVKARAHSYYEYYFYFMEVPIPVPGDMITLNEEYKNKSEIEKRKQVVFQSNFYKLITEQIRPESLDAIR